MENGLVPSINNTRRTSSTSLPVSDQRRTILSEAGLNHKVARTIHTTERFNGISIQLYPPPKVATFVENKFDYSVGAALMSTGDVENSHNPLHSE
jgi:hypothetical protein